jgi:hypothetical protein
MRTQRTGENSRSRAAAQPLACLRPEQPVQVLIPLGRDRSPGADRRAWTRDLDAEGQAGRSRWNPDASEQVGLWVGGAATSVLCLGDPWVPGVGGFQACWPASRRVTMRTPAVCARKLEAEAALTGAQARSTGRGRRGKR